MNQITAYFIGGPKHGDVDIVSGDARDVRIPITNDYARKTYRDVVNEGHYSYTTDFNYKTGIYRREFALRMPGINQANPPFLFVWAGLA